MIEKVLTCFFTSPEDSSCRMHFASKGNVAQNAASIDASKQAADWLRQGPRQSSCRSLLAAAISSDGQYLAVGGGDKKVHIWDTRSRDLLKVNLKLLRFAQSGTLQCRSLFRLL